MVHVKYWRQGPGKISMLKLFICTIAFLLTINVAHAEDAAAQLLALLQPIQNLSGHFEQQSLDKNEKLLQRQNGSFVVLQSGEFIWRILPPYEQHIISNGTIINIYDPDLEQLTIKALDQKVQVIPLMLFSENGRQIVQQYDVSKVAGDSSTEVTFILKPRQAGSLFDRLLISFSNASAMHTPTRLDIIDSLKQITRVRFDQVFLNQSIDRKQFEFSAPAGIDVIDERH